MSSPRFTCRWCGVMFIGWSPDPARPGLSAVQRHADHTWECPVRLAEVGADVSV